MKKYLFFSLVIIGLLALTGWSLAEESTFQRMRAYEPFEDSSTDESRTSGMFEPGTFERMEKCGVNSFSVTNECGIGVFKNVFFQCHDGYEQKKGGESSCKSSEAWQKHAESICATRCGIIQTRIEEAVPGEKPHPETVEVKPMEISVCYPSEELMKEYNKFIFELKEAESDGDALEIKKTTERIIALKMKISESNEECGAAARQLGTLRQLGAAQEQVEEISRPESRPVEPIVIDRCREVVHMREKLAYYENLRNLSNADVIKNTGVPREELGIENVVAEISEVLEKLKEQCKIQNETTVSGRVMAIEQIPVVVAEPVKPVVVESGQEIGLYYRARIERITTATDIDKQIQELKMLREEIDHLIEKLIRSRKEIEAGELGNLVTEIKVSRGEIKADDIIVKTTTKKMLIDVGDKPISIEPTKKDVLIKDGGLEVKAEEVFIKENILRVGGSNVRLAASYIVEKLKLSPKFVELKEENEKAVYKMKVDERRKLFGFIPLTIQKTITTDADNGDILKERRPWYAIFTTKF